MPAAITALHPPQSSQPVTESGSESPTTGGPWLDAVPALLDRFRPICAQGDSDLHALAVLQAVLEEQRRTNALLQRLVAVAERKPGRPAVPKGRL